MSLRVKKFVGDDAGQWGLNTIGAVGALVIAAVFLPLQFLVDNVFLRALPPVIGLAGGVYLVTTRRSRAMDERSHWKLTPELGHFARMTVLVGLASMVYVGTLTGGRTLPFFGIAVLVGALIFGQILFQERASLTPSLVLVQVVAFAVVVRGTALLTTPGTIGVDSWVHIPTYASSIRQSGQLAAIADSKYYGAPLYHLLVVTAADLFNSTLRTALYATLGVVMPLSVLLVYYATRGFLPVRWALFATASYSIADHVIRWGLHLIPTSLGLVFFLGAFYAVGKTFAGGDSRRMHALLSFFVVAVVLTHQISAFILLVFLGVGAALQVLFEVSPAGTSLRGATEAAGSYVNFVGVFLFALVITLIDWSLSPAEGPSFLMGMIELIASRTATAGFLELNSARVAASVAGNEAIQAMATSVPVPVEMLDTVGFLLLFFVTLLGLMSLLHVQRRNLLSATWIGSTTSMLLVVLGMPLFGLNFFIPGRWYAFVYVPMVVLGAYGMWNLERNMSVRGFVVVLLLFALVFPGAMIINHKATHDNPITDDYYHQFAFSESELDAARTIATLHPDGTTLRADDPYYLFFENSEEVLAGPLVVTDEGSFSDDYVVYREYQRQGGTQVRYDETMVRAQPSLERVCRPSMDVLYTNGDVQYCRSMP